MGSRLRLACCAVLVASFAYGKQYLGLHACAASVAGAPDLSDNGPISSDADDAAVPLSDESGNVVVVHPRPARAMRLTGWEMGAWLACGGVLAGAALIALGGFLFFKTSPCPSPCPSPQASKPQPSSNIKRQLGRYAMGLLGATALTASLMFGAMSPERKVGPRSRETDPRLLPRFDEHCAWMATQPVPRAQLDAQSSARAVPRIIHQIWFGDPAKIRGRDLAWRAYAAQFNYSYRLYTERDLAAIPLSENNRRIVNYELAHGDFWCASDIVRYAILADQGGIYLDMDMRPPQRDGQPVPFNAVVNPTGLTLMTEEFGRDCGARSALFVANGLISAPIADATLVHALATLSENWAAINQHARSELTAGGIAMCHAMFASGPFFLSRILNGTPQILSFREAVQMKIVDGDIQ